MKTTDSVLSSGAKRSERASERTPRLVLDKQALKAKIWATEQLLHHLALGMRNLRAMRPVPFNVKARVLAQAAKIRSAETKLFKLRQTRLL
jgi:hypothetical protein